jgi:hypothetical protein
MAQLSARFQQQLAELGLSGSIPWLTSSTLVLLLRELTESDNVLAVKIWSAERSASN